MKNTLTSLALAGTLALGLLGCDEQQTPEVHRNYNGNFTYVDQGKTNYFDVQYDEFSGKDRRCVANINSEGKTFVINQTGTGTLFIGDKGFSTNNDIFNVSISDTNGNSTTFCGNEDGLKKGSFESAKNLYGFIRTEIYFREQSKKALEEAEKRRAESNTSYLQMQLLKVPEVKQRTENTDAK